MNHANNFSRQVPDPTKVGPSSSQDDIPQRGVRVIAGVINRFSPELQHSQHAPFPALNGDELQEDNHAPPHPSVCTA